MTNSKLRQLAGVFLKLGPIGFGGPAAHIAMMEDEVVTRRGWLTSAEFLDLVGATNLIPGPNSTEMAIHVGYIYAGWRGLIVAGACFICPAVALTAALAWAYREFGELPQIAPFFDGIQPVVLAIIGVALWRLGKKALKNRCLWGVGVAVALSVLLGVNQVLALFLGGILGAIALNSNFPGTRISPLLGFPLSLSLAQTPPTIISPPLWQLGLFFLKVGSVLYGSGYVLVAFLENELVGKYGWLTQPELLDAIAIGQFTPGPVLSTATFIGYQIAGFPGAIVSTVGIFLPSFAFVALLNPILPTLRRSKWMSGFLDAVNASAVALMAVVTLRLAQAVVFPPTGLNGLAVGIAAVSILLAVRWRVNAAWLVFGGALIGGLL
ncbi:MAG: chromate efflux transporter [Cyanobacteria bacterium J055]|nr:MAG: chromate efflux transporter [Cyanobacteria bacterium J055]